jgi:hypothetical protein
MRTPADGWDREERAAIEELRDTIEEVQIRHDGDPHVALLRAARHDALPSELQDAAQHFLTRDPWSRALIDGLDEAEPSLESGDVDRLLARIQKDTVAPRRTTSSIWLRLAFGGTALATLALAALLIWKPPAFRPQPAPSATSQEARVAPVVPPPFELPLDKPEVVLSLAALTWRGASSSHQLLNDLKPALDAFRADDYAGADRAFAALEITYPNSVEVFFYGGVARLFLNDPTHAIAALERAGQLADNAFAPQVEWYRAVSEQRAGHTADARARLETLCRGRSDRADRACEMLKKPGSPSPPNGR